MVESGDIQPIKVKLTHIAKIKEKVGAQAFKPSEQHYATTVAHNQGWLRDKNGILYKEWISPSKLSQVDIGRTYKLYKIGSVNIVPAFVEN